jgi:hypothetical protein
MDKSDSTRPGPLVFIRHVVASRSLPRLLRALPAQPSREAARWGWVAARNQARRLPDAGAPRCRFPLIARAALSLKAASYLIDGEAVACDDNGLPVFDRLRYRRDDRRVFLYAFDLIELDGDDLRREPIERCKVLLIRLLAKAPVGLQVNDHIVEPGDVVFRHACQLGFEGIVSKRLGSPYRSGRSRHWSAPRTCRSLRGRLLRRTDCMGQPPGSLVWPLARISIRPCVKPSSSNDLDRAPTMAFYGVGRFRHAIRHVQLQFECVIDLKTGLAVRWWGRFRDRTDRHFGR